MENIRYCSKCKQTKNISEFYKNKSRKDNYNRWCRQCTTEYYKKWKEIPENIEKTRESTRKSNARNKDKRKAYQKEYRTKNLQILRQKDREKHQDLKFKVFSHYCNGDIKCACCGERHIEFLSLDHANGDGATHRRELAKGKERTGNGGKIHRWIIKNNYPSGFRVLCYNCNCSRGFFGYCPHEKESIKP